MFHTKCGCPDCKGFVVGFTRQWWKIRRNRSGRFVGSHPKPHSAKQNRSRKSVL